MYRHILIVILAASMAILPMMTAYSQSEPEVQKSYVVLHENGKVTAADYYENGGWHVESYDTKAEAEAAGYTVPDYSAKIVSSDVTLNDDGTVSVTEVYDDGSQIPALYPDKAGAEAFGYTVPEADASDAGSDAAASDVADDTPATSCARISLGGIGEGGEGAAEEDQQVVVTDPYTGQEMYYDSAAEAEQAGYDSTQYETQAQTDTSADLAMDSGEEEVYEEELMCEDFSAPGPVTCYEGDTPLACEFDGVDVFCP